MADSAPGIGAETMDKTAPVFVAGGRGLVGSAIVRRLKADGFERVLAPGRKDVDLTDPKSVEGFFAREKPAYVFLAAAKVGGIHANSTFPADFIRDNLAIEINSIDAAWRHGVAKLLFLGSSCIYPRLAPQPMKEEHLLTGPLEPTNQPYAIAKIAGIEMVRSYRRQHGFRAISLMPTNLYGPGDNYDLQTSHVLPALIRKFHEAKQAGSPSVTVWGTGTPRREFLHVDDLADACLFLMDNYEDDIAINVGVGEDVSIAELAALVRDVVGFEGSIVQDTSKPDGAPRKLLDVTRLTRLGWTARVGLRDGIASTYRAFLADGAART